jgi:inhibitor of KinA
MTHFADPKFTSVSDCGVLVSFSQDISDSAHKMVIGLDTSITEDPPLGMIETVPALVNLLVSFDPLLTDHVAIELAVKERIKFMTTTEQTGQERVIDVCYDAPFAPDLAPVSSATGLSQDAVINAHLAGDYHVLMYGFSPGYAYMSGVSKTIQVPRKTAPVRDVPAGSVIIAGPQCLVTTLTMPTGWSIIGRSPTPILTGNPDRPFLFDVGDTVTFNRIDPATFFKRQKGSGQ